MSTANNPSNTRVVITHAFRTPIGKYLGALKDLSAPELGTQIVQGLIQKSGLAPNLVDELFFGHGRQAGSGPNPARQISLRSGIPATTPAFTINQACASGLRAIILAAQSIMLGHNSIAIAGGVESMSNMPFMLPKMREGLRLGHTKLIDAMYQDGFSCPLANELMGETAERLAQHYVLSRKELDQYALRSQRLCQQAREENRFQDEIIPITLMTRKKEEQLFATDEHPRDNLVLEKLAKLPPVFNQEKGMVTAGNSSGITDGAAALLLMSEAAAIEHGFEPLAIFEAWAQAGTDPKIMGIGPVPACKKLEALTQRETTDYDRVELNEAFAAQVLACNEDLGIAQERLNVNGGAIALGHPIGCTGARIVVSLLHDLRKQKLHSGLATLCVSGGMGVAASFIRP